MAPEERAALRRLVTFVESEVSPGFRPALFEYLLPRILEASEPLPFRPADASAGHGSDQDTFEERLRLSGRVDLAPYDSLLARRGEPLLKALVALHVGETQLGIRWMTPTEVGFLLREVAGVRSAYRSNISNALRREASLVARRSRGRGFEYGLTRRGRRMVEQQVRLAEAEPSTQP